MSENVSYYSRRNNRYPVRRTIYMQTVGRLLPRRVSQILKELGFKVWINPSQGNNIDLKVWNDDNLIIVGEILNWSIGSKLAEKRLNKMISNLNNFDCRKLLVYTTLDQASVSKFIQNGIDVLEIGFQLLPKSYYDFFSARRQIERREIDSATTKNEIKENLSSYLERSIFCI